jgi:CheY-like chemotaxis protein
MFPGLSMTPLPATPQSEEPAPPPARRLRVLVADDGRVDRRVVSAILERRGHAVIAVEDGVKALAELKETAYDAAVLDLHMPGLDGGEVAASIRAFEKAAGRCPLLRIVALSGASSQDDWRQGHGIDCFLSKPVEPTVLACAIEGTPAPVPSAPAGAAPHGERVVFDLGEALARVRGKHPLLAELVRIFLEDAEIQMDILQEAIGAADLDRIERAAHRLKGSARNVSAQRVADAAGKIETRLRAGQAGAAADLWGSLEGEVAAARKALTGFLAQNKG